MAGEQRVFCCELHRADAILDDVLSISTRPSLEEDQEPVPQVGDVGQLLTEARAERDARTLLVEPHTPKAFSSTGGGGSGSGRDHSGEIVNDPVDAIA